MKTPRLALPQDWHQALRQGRGVAAELSLPADGLASAQALAEAWQHEKDRSSGAFFFLESQGIEKRFSLLAGGPLFSFLARGRRGVWNGGGITHDLSAAPEDAFEQLGLAFRRQGVLEEREGLTPFLGWLSYEAGARYEKLELPKPDPLGLPDWYLTLPGEWAWLDEDRGEWRFRLLLADEGFFRRMEESLDLRMRPEAEYGIVQPEKMLKDWQERVKARLAAAAGLIPLSLPKVPRSLEIQDSHSRQDYCGAVSRARAYISAGDIFQANLSHRLSSPYPGRAWPLFRRLAEINPSPHAAFADLGSYQVICGSPERLFLQQGSHVETHPIAGTIPKSKSAAELALSEKDRAEHIMTVDIERNDLSRVCEPGSVRVRELMVVESYSHLRHLVSKVQGTLCRGKDLPDLFRAAFPGGSITGAPKIRCMQFISELERERRGIYTGGLGYWDPIHRRADFSIIIRTIILAHGRAWWQVGAGIVADSVPEKEWEETLHKAEALKLALETAPL